MTKEQLSADVREAKSNPRNPDDNRLPGELKRSTGKERRFRDRGTAQDSQVWRDHLRRERD